MRDERKDLRLYDLVICSSRELGVGVASCVQVGKFHVTIKAKVLSFSLKVIPTLGCIVY